MEKKYPVKKIMYGIATTTFAIGLLVGYQQCGSNNVGGNATSTELSFASGKKFVMHVADEEVTFDVDGKTYHPDGDNGTEAIASPNADATPTEPCTSIEIDENTFFLACNGDQETVVINNASGLVTSSIKEAKAGNCRIEGRAMTARKLTFDNGAIVWELVDPEDQDKSYLLDDAAELNCAV